MSAKIITFGGGKGGTGRSVIAANLGVEVARRGKKVIVGDIDLGASNLHVFLGMKSPTHNLKDFMLKKNKELGEILLDTGIEGLKLLSDAGDMPGSANLSYVQKMKMIDHIKKLEADYILLDLGPGHTYNIIDYFETGDIPVLVSTPEITSIMNIYSFVRGVVFRKLQRDYKSNNDVNALIKQAGDPDNEYNIKSVTGLLDRIGAEDREDDTIPSRYREEIDMEKRNEKPHYSDETIKQELEEFKPKLIVNKVGTEERGNKTAKTITTLAKQYLGVEVEYIGYIYEDTCVRFSISKMEPFVIGYPDSKATDCIRQIADNFF